LEKTKGNQGQDFQIIAKEGGKLEKRGEGDEKAKGKWHKANE